MVDIVLPEKVRYIIDTLIKSGYEAYAVGGCIRDILLGRIPEDWDITTSAKPEEVKTIFRHTVDTGIQHGTITVILEKQGFEVTTYRIDGEYEDGRRPLNVEFTSELAEDLKRRDFTINAMAYNENQGLVDMFGGIRHIEQKLICCVGNPHDRFEEDALRILRAVRFAGQLGFSIEKDTEAAIREKAETLKKISAERIRTELTKLILSPNPNLLENASELGICRVILPEMDRMLKQEQNNPHHIFSVGKHTIKALEELNRFYPEREGAKNKFFTYDKKIHTVLAFTLLLHDVGKPECHTVGDDGFDHFYGHGDKSAAIGNNVLKRLRFDNYTIDLATRLIKWHDFRYTLTETSMRKAVSKIGPEVIELLFVVQRMDILAQSPKTWNQKLTQLEEAKDLFQSIQEKNQCLSLKDLAVNGKDLMEELGIRPGPDIGKNLNRLLEYVLEYPEKNERSHLISLLKKNS